MFNFITKVLAAIEIIGLTGSALAVLFYVDGVKGLISIPILLFTIPYWWLLIRKDNK